MVKSYNYGSIYLDSHIQKIDDLDKCDPPYYILQLNTTRFELVTEVYYIDFSQNLTINQKETLAFTVEKNGYNLVLSNHENLRWLDKGDPELIDIIFNRGQIQFKLKPNEDKETNLQIIVLNSEKNISIESLTNQEISLRIKHDDKKEIKYYINLSKNKYLINHFDFTGKLEFYISKEEITGSIIEKILKSDDINLDLFEKVTEGQFEIDNKKIMVIKKRIIYIQNY